MVIVYIMVMYFSHKINENQKENSNIYSYGSDNCNGVGLVMIIVNVIYWLPKIRYA